MERQARDDMVRSLVLEAGRLMEDLSPELALVLPTSQLARSVRIAALLAGADSITSLLRAAHAMSDVRPATQQFPQP